MKNNILAIFTIFAVPLLYHYLDETVTLILTAIVAVSYIIYDYLKKNKHIYKPTKLLIILFFLIGSWFFTVGRSLIVSCSIFCSFPVFIKLCILLLICYSVCKETLSDSNNYIGFYKIACLTGFFQGLLAIFEYIKAPPIPSTWLDPASKELFRTRCCGIMTDPNIFASYLSALFIMTLGLILFSKEKKEIILSAISLVFCGTGIFMTLSRGGWVALSAALFSFVVALIISRKKIDIFNYKAITSSLILLFIIFILGPFKYRLFSITKPSDMTFYQRTLINKGIMGAVSKIPITGHGLHTFSQIYPFYRIVGGDYPLYAHNEYLQSMVETGFLSSVFLAFITLGILIISYKSAKQRKYDSIVFAAVFISFVIQNISGFSSRIFPTSILIALSVGALLASQLKIKELKNDYTRQLQYKCINYSLISLVLIVLLGGLYIYIPQYKIYKANQLLFVGKVKEASNIYEKILTYQPSNSIAANSLGFIYQINKQNKKAANTWLKAFEYNKFEAIFPINLARLYLKTNSEQSDLYYKKALELDPASENYRLEYANFLISHNKTKQAKEILQKGLTYSPGFHNVYKGFQEMEDLLKTL